MRSQKQPQQKFYLVGITGRTSFILQNLNGLKFKITIGNELKCSCNPNCSRQCIHTLHALQQIFYLPASSQLLSLKSYTDQQLRYIIASRRIHLNKIDDFLKYVRRTKIIFEEDEEDDDNICAICHMQIVKCDAITTCSNACQNAFHFDCFTQWAKYQVKENRAVRCPLCRDQKPEQFIMEIKQKKYEMKDEATSKKVGVEFNYYCDGCQLSEIQSNESVYKCVMCEDVTLCERCFKLGKHSKHSFIWKYGSDKKWRECQDRKAKKKYDQEEGLIRIKLKTNNKRIYNFLACALPCFFSKNTRWNIMKCKKLDFKVDELSCILCSDSQKAFLRRLNCGHFVHHRCLRKRIEKNRFYCKLDGQKYLLGYEALMKHKLLNEKVQEVEIEEESSDEEEKEEKEEREEKENNQCNQDYIRTPSKKHRKADKSATSCESRKKNSPKKGHQERNKSLNKSYIKVHSDFKHSL